MCHRCGLPLPPARYCLESCQPPSGSMDMGRREQQLEGQTAGRRHRGRRVANTSGVQSDLYATRLARLKVRASLYLYTSLKGRGRQRDKTPRPERLDMVPTAYRHATMARSWTRWRAASVPALMAATNCAGVSMAPCRCARSMMKRCSTCRSMGVSPAMLSARAAASANVPLRPMPAPQCTATGAALRRAATLLEQPALREPERRSRAKGSGPL